MPTLARMLLAKPGPSMVSVFGSLCAYAINRYQDTGGRPDHSLAVLNSKPDTVKVRSGSQRRPQSLGHNLTSLPGRITPGRRSNSKHTHWFTNTSGTSSPQRSSTGSTGCLSWLGLLPSPALSTLGINQGAAQEQNHGYHAHGKTKPRLVSMSTSFDTARGSIAQKQNAGP